MKPIIHIPSPSSPSFALPQGPPQHTILQSYLSIFNSRVCVHMSVCMSVTTGLCVYVHMCASLCAHVCSSVHMSVSFCEHVCSSTQYHHHEDCCHHPRTQCSISTKTPLLIPGHALGVFSLGQLPSPFRLPAHAHVASTSVSSSESRGQQF